MSNEKGIFTSGPIDKYLFSLAMPALITLIASMSFIAVDTYFVSRLGKDPLTAISFIFPVVAVFQMIAVGLGIAASSVLSRLIGAGKTHEVSISIVTIVIIGIFLTAISVPILDLSMNLIFHAMGATTSIMPYIKQFMHVWLFGVVFILTGFIGSNVLRVHGKAALSAKLQISSSVLNIMLSPLFIFTFHWGMTGSALAGVLARCIMTIVMYQYIVSKYLSDFRSIFEQALQKFWQHANVLGAIAVPAMLTNIIGPLSALWMVHLLAKCGGDNIVAGFGIASRVEMLAVIPLYALSASVGPIIGQNMGAKIYHRCYRTLIRSYQICLFWSFIIATALYFTGYFIAQIFTQNAEIIHSASIYLSILPWSYASWGIIMMTNANFNSMGKPLISTMITILRLVVIFIPLSYWLSIKYGYLGVYLAFAISNIIASLGAAYTAVKQWRDMNEHLDHLSTTAIVSTRD